MKYPNGCGLTNGEIPNDHEKVKKMSIEYMRTTKQTKAGTYQMQRIRDTVIVYLQPKIGGEDYIGENAILRRLRVGEMKREIHAEKYELAGISRWSLSKTDTWKATNVKVSHRNPEQDVAEPWMETYAEDESFHAASTPSALKEFVRTYDDFITRTLLKAEGEVFNPITNETRVHFINVLNEPLQETWVRISDDEEALARIWNNEFKKLAGAILPVKAWKCNDHHARPQRNVWASFDNVETKAYGMTSGVSLPPHLWTIIDPDTEKAVPIIDPADEDARLEREHQERVEANEEADRLNAHLEQQEDYSAGIAYPERKKQPVGSLGQPTFEVGKTYTNWPHRNATCRVIDVGEGEVRVELKNSNGNIVRRWADVKWRRITLGRPLHPFGLQDTDCILVDVEPFNMPCFNACDIVEVDA